MALANYILPRPTTLKATWKVAVQRQRLSAKTPALTFSINIPRK
jgi:hypothetical protein